MSYKRTVFFSHHSFKDDFAEVFDKMTEKLWQKQEKYGKGYLSHSEIGYYLDRLKQEIEEFEKSRTLEEALDIGNFAMMLILHVLKEGT